MICITCNSVHVLQNVFSKVTVLFVMLILNYTGKLANYNTEFIYFFYFFIVYCKLQSTQLNRVISKGREAGTIHRWFTGVVLLS